MLGGLRVAAFSRVLVHGAYKARGLVTGPKRLFVGLEDDGRAAASRTATFRTRDRAWVGVVQRLSGNVLHGFVHFVRRDAHHAAAGLAGRRVLQDLLLSSGEHGDVDVDGTVGLRNVVAQHVLHGVVGLVGLG